MQQQLLRTYSGRNFFGKHLEYLAITQERCCGFFFLENIRYAAEHQKGIIFGNYGNGIMFDPITHLPDKIMLSLNNQQLLHFPRLGERYDKYTFAQAIHYFEKYQPRLLWISLDDADRAAHNDDLNAYHQAMAFYDDMIDEILATLKRLNLEKETLLIITTDHGRGDGKYWTTHGPEYPESQQTWAFVVNGELTPTSTDGTLSHYSTLSIRPTIEKALGVSRQ